ncbi:hypothetical protein Zmor_014899 [Zophobas morio]|uniref:Endonuclease/exonuclease/phosphatase domain-containing protein n=1 Tax=Zophobas morio TaxID=2755281 RepID=A0AA38IIC7_9CUCU|nr:hypothetical protein Zmor_014899 [Zophobas morio]
MFPRPRCTLGHPPNVQPPIPLSQPPNRPHDLNSTHINISTINVNCLTFKVNAVKNLIQTDNIHILAIQETKTKREIKFPHFVKYQRHSTSIIPNARGTALLISRKFPSVQHDLPHNLANLQTIAANVLISNISITIICYYNPPSETIFSLLLQYASQLPNAILIGDFNSRHTDFGDTVTTRNGRKLVNNLTNYPLFRIENKQPTLITHNGASIPDHITITEPLIPKFNTPCSIGTTVTSEHLPLTAELLLPAPPQPDKFVLVHDNKHADWAKYKEHITKNLPPIYETRGTDAIDIQILQFTDTITIAKEHAIPVKRIPKNKRPLPPRILTLIKQKRKIYRDFVRTRDPLLKTHFNRLNAQIRCDINQFREEKWSDTCVSLDYRNGKQFWNKFKLITGQKTQTSNHLIQNGTFVSSPEDQSNTFAQTLEEIHEIPRPKFQSRPLPPSPKRSAGIP